MDDRWHWSWGWEVTRDVVQSCCQVHGEILCVGVCDIYDILNWKILPSSKKKICRCFLRASRGLIARTDHRDGQ